MRRAALLALALAAAGCVKPSDEAPARVYTLADIREAARNHQMLGENVSSDGMIAFRGQPIPLRSRPWATTDALQSPDVDGTTLFAAFAEGQPAAYITTEVWYDRDQVWVQPIYIPVTRWDPAKPFAAKVPGALAVFAPGAESSFYSPYWRIEYAVVPEGTSPADLRTPKDVLDRTTEVHDGPLNLSSVVPLDMAPAAPAGDVPRRPLTGEAVGRVRVSTALVDGEKVGVFNYGNDRFTADESGVVAEAPIFHWVAPDPSGQLADVGLPAVAGVGPLYSGASPDVDHGVPRFGGLWRLYLAELPAGAAVFVPPALVEERGRLTSAGVSAPVPDDAAANDPRAPQYALRVASDPRCFEGDGGFPDACTWLDSQHAVEQTLPATAIHQTDTTLTCPLVEYLGQPVPN